MRSHTSGQRQLRGNMRRRKVWCCGPGPSHPWSDFSEFLEDLRDVVTLGVLKIVIA